MTSTTKFFFITGIIISLIMIYVDQSGTAVTLVNMTQDLNLSTVSQHWVINTYLLSLASLLLLAGRASDYFGYKKVYFIGHVIFLLASVLVGCSLNTWMVLLGRSLQGVGASILVTGNITLISLHFPQNSRGKIIGIVVAIGGIFLTAAPIFSGLFTEYLSWRWLFWINVPMVILAIILVMTFCPQDPELPQKKQLDKRGVLLSIISIFCFVFAIMQAPDWGIFSPEIIAIFLVSIISFYFFIYTEKRVKIPFVNLGIFKNKYIVISNVILITANFTMIAEVYWTLWLRQSIQFSPILTGLALIPAMIPTIFLAPFAGKITDKVGAAIPLLIGSIMATIGMLWFMVFSLSNCYWLVFPGIFIYGFAPPLIFTPAVTVAMNALKPDLRGLASGVANTNRQLGSALGLAFMGLVLLTYMNSSNGNSPYLSNYSLGFFYAMILPVLMSFLGMITAIIYWRISKNKI